MQKTALTLILPFILSLANANESSDQFKNNIGINLLALPVANGVISYERSFYKQSVWLGLEHHFNDFAEDEDRNTNSIALEYRRYLTGERSRAEGLFAAIYAKTRWGKESLPENASHFHRYTILFGGINAGYQYQIKRLVLSAFAGYGLPLSVSEESYPMGNPNDFNQGYKRDLRLGITVGFAF